MNDRCKHRVWDKLQNKYLKDSEETWYGIDTNGYIYQFNKDYATENVAVTDISENVVVELSTGLKDKNGKLIFEGDILKLGNFKNNLAKVVYYDTNLAFGLLKQSSYAERHYGKGAMDYLHLHEVDNKKYEVIGNIYENKELLGE